MIRKLSILWDLHRLLRARGGFMKSAWPGYRGSEADRFWSKVQKSRGCWEWIGSRTKKNYGQFRKQKVPGRKKKNVQAHRWAYANTIGPIPKGLFVCHHCDNPPCVNPKHLFLGTHRDNMLDMRKKGRGNKFFGGGGFRFSKLTKANVVKIRRLYVPKKFGHDRTAKMFGVHPTTVGLAIRRITWKDI